MRIRLLLPNRMLIEIVDRPAITDRTYARRDGVSLRRNGLPSPDQR